MLVLDSAGIRVAESSGRRVLMSRITGQAGFAMGVFAMAGLASFIVFGSATAQPAQVAVNAPASATASAEVTTADRKKMLMQYCTACHNDRLKTAGMTVVPLNADNLPAHLATWEKILRRLSVGEMPPRGMPRPPKEQIASFTDWLGTSLDKLGEANPDPGKWLHPGAGVCFGSQYQPQARTKTRGASRCPTPHAISGTSRS